MIPILQNDDIDSFIKNLDKRKGDTTSTIRNSVESIVKAVKERGDQAIFDLTQKFDKANLSKKGLKVSFDTIQQKVESVDPNLIRIMTKSADNIRKYHEKGKKSSWTYEDNGAILGQRVTPLERVGIYSPGGRAVYPSSLLMAAIPALVAGVKEVVVVSPPDKDGHLHPSVLAAASVAGVTEIYRVGGAQAVAALAFGTETIRPVDKIVGPGNIYVAEAKRQVYGIVDIDMIAGPSEVVILADDKANSDYVASDLLAQAEHDPYASSVCVTTSLDLAEAIKKAVVKQVKTLSRKEIIKTSLNDWGAILVARDMKNCLKIVNILAAEHLGLHVENPWKMVEKIQNAGAIFLGDFAPETVGDYWAGPNHVLPTNQTARFASPLGTDDFQKVSSIIQFSKEALERDAEAIMIFAKTEGLDGHANAVQQRLLK